MPPKKLHDYSDCNTLPEALLKIRTAIDFYMQFGAYLADQARKVSTPEQDTNPANARRFNSLKNALESRLKMSKAWLGRSLTKLGEQTPYSPDGKRGIDDLKPTADQAAFSYTKDLMPDQVVKHIDLLRSDLVATRNAIIILSDMPFTRNQEQGKVIVAMESWEHASNYLVEAGFVLGFVLGEIQTQRKWTTQES